MITHINARNVNDALSDSMWKLHISGIQEGSRNGRVLVMPTPVITSYAEPRERVLFNDYRDANPYFHLMEALWMLAGRRDVEFPARFVKRMYDYSDDGATLHGAYGARWRYHFATDQLNAVAEMLRANPSDRRAVISMWDANCDLGRQGKDVPCNTHIYLRAHDNNHREVLQLDMTVMCRSNDAIWGAHGANAVHFSVLQEYLAHDINSVVGTLYQLSNNYHVYMDQYDPTELRTKYHNQDLYGDDVQPYPLIHRDVTIAEWRADLLTFLTEPEGMRIYADDFFNLVAVPMYGSWVSHRRGEHTDAMVLAHKIEAADWRLACVAWLRRRAT